MSLRLFVYRVVATHTYLFRHRVYHRFPRVAFAAAVPPSKVPALRYSCIYVRFNQTPLRPRPFVLFVYPSRPVCLFVRSCVCLRAFYRSRARKTPSPIRILDDEMNPRRSLRQRITKARCRSRRCRESERWRRTTRCWGSSTLSASLPHKGDGMTDSCYDVSYDIEVLYTSYSIFWPYFFPLFHPGRMGKNKAHATIIF